jgi:CRP/FNR family transcriptional regulator
MRRSPVSIVAVSARHRQRGTATSPDPGPSLSGARFGPEAAGKVVRLLSDRQRLQLAGIATRLRLPARSILYREDTVADWVFIVGQGIAKSFRDLPSGKRRIMAFLFPDDIFGLAEAGRYVNSAQSVTPLVVYRIRVDALTDTIKRDPELNYQVLSKITHELREAQLKSVIIGRRDAPGRLAMFLRMLERRTPGSRPACDIAVPMSRTDTAQYLGLTLEAVIRASHTLERNGIVAFPGAHVARVVNRARFDKLASAI